MPLFLTEEEFRICSNDPLLLASKADEFIISLRRQLDTSIAQADAASVNAEQTYNVLEQRYASLSAEIGRVQAENEELVSDAEKKAKELAEVWSLKLGNEAVLVCFWVETHTEAMFELRRLVLMVDFYFCWFD